MERFESIELIPGLPSELGLECLTRLPHTAHPVAAGVCRHWRRLLRSADFYHHRKKMGFTHKVACLIQSIPSSASADSPSGDRKQGTGSPSFGITVFDPVSRTWERLESVPEYPDGLPLFSQICGSEGKLVLMGGWDPVSYDPVTDIFVYDFAAAQWRRGKDMPSKRSFFAIGAAPGGSIFVAGGHDEGKNALSSAWMYSPSRDEWSELTRMSQERDECEGVMIGDEFWVVSGYGTERQGAFESSAEVYNTSTGEWRRVEGAWEEGRCPRACVGLGKDGSLMHWGESNSGVRVGSCGVMLGNRAVVSGSEYEGAAQGFYLVENGEGQTGKFVRVDDVAIEFTGFVQSGCCVEI